MNREIVEDFYNSLSNMENAQEEPLSLLAWGKPGSGKTYLMGTFPNLFVIDTDLGLLTLAGKNVKKVSITSDMEVYATCIGLIQDAKFKRGPWASGGDLGHIETIGVDSFSRLSNMMFEEIMEEQKKDTRQAYNVLLKRLSTIAALLRELSLYGYNVVVTAGESWKEDSSGISQPMPLCNGSFREFLPHYFDASTWLSVTKRNGKAIYTAHFLPEKGHNAKSRLPLSEKVENATFKTFKEALAKKFQQEKK